MLRPSPRANDASASSTRSDDFQPSALALFPERHGLLHCIFHAVQTAARDGLANERLLVRGELQGLSNRLSSAALLADARGAQICAVLSRLRHKYQTATDE